MRDIGLGGQGTFLQKHAGPESRSDADAKAIADRWHTERKRNRGKSKVSFCIDERITEGALDYCLKRDKQLKGLTAD